MAAHLWLVGMMGSGKTTVGRLVAERRGAGFVDTDDLVEQRTGRAVATVISEDGEAAFRAEEKAAVAAAAAADGPTVVATGGGAVLDDANVNLMRETGTVVWLAAPAGTLAARVGDGADRPLSGGGDLDRLAAILAERERRYAAAAHAAVGTDGVDPERVADAVEALWRDT